MATDYGGVIGTSVAKSKYKPKDEDFKTRRVEIEKADNGGFIITCYHEPIREPRDGPSHYKEPTKKVFETREAMLKGVAQYL